MEQDYLVHAQSQQVCPLQTWLSQRNAKHDAPGVKLSRNQSQGMAAWPLFLSNIDSVNKYRSFKVRLNSLTKTMKHIQVVIP